MLQSEIDISSCDLCPRVCGVDRSAGARGVCGADGRLRIARAALHFWEEPPISGTHGSGTVFFSWCPLRCVYCQNAVIADGEAGAEISIERLAQIYSELQAKGALNINLVTPTHYAPHARAALDLARERGMGLPSFGTPRDTKRFAPSEKTEVMRMCISPITNMPLPIWLPDIQRLLIILRSPSTRFLPWSMR